MARILIVDDSPTEMYKLTAMLENMGIRYSRRKTALTAWLWLARKSPMRC